MKEYKTAKKSAFFIYLSAAFIIALFIYVFTIPFTSENSSVLSNAILITTSLLFIVFAIITVIHTIKSRLIITKNTILLKSIFCNTELKLNEIRGYKIEENHISILSKNSNKKNIKFNNYIENLDEIIFWLSMHFKNLTNERTALENQEILKNVDFGFTKQETELKLKKAKTTAFTLNIAGITTTIACLFYPSPYDLIIIAAMVIPIISLLAISYFKGLIRIDQENKSAYPTLFWAICFTSIGLVTRAFFDFNIENYSKVWLPAISFAFVLTGIVILITNEVRFHKIRDYFKAFFIFTFFSSRLSEVLLTLDVQIVLDFLPSFFVPYHG